MGGLINRLAAPTPTSVSRKHGRAAIADRMCYSRKTDEINSIRITQDISAYSALAEWGSVARRIASINLSVSPFSI
jgi:hypothetical protein